MATSTCRVSVVLKLPTVSRNASSHTHHHTHSPHTHHHTHSPHTHTTTHTHPTHTHPTHTHTHPTRTPPHTLTPHTNTPKQAHDYNKQFKLEWWSRLKSVLTISMSCSWSLVHKNSNCLWSSKRRFTKEMGQMG